MGGMIAARVSFHGLVIDFILNAKQDLSEYRVFLVACFGESMGHPR